MRTVLQVIRQKEHNEQKTISWRNSGKFEELQESTWLKFSKSKVSRIQKIKWPFKEFGVGSDGRYGPLQVSVMEMT